MSALPIARLFGFEIRIHVSWAVILAIIAVTIQSQVGVVAPETDPATRWAVGAVVAAAFLLSALAHELGHAIAARRAGMPGGPIIVYFFGGAASATLEATRPRDEVIVALAGPLVSIVIAAVLLAVTGVGEVAGGTALAVGRIALVIGLMNLVLGVANLLPAFPLDGGRVVRGLAWARTGDPNRGLQIAASSGRNLGIVMAAIGIVGIIAVDSIDGLMLTLAGWFLVSSARAIDRTADVERLLEGVNVADVMDRDISGVPPGLTLDTFAEQILRDGPAASVPVMRGLEVLGMIGPRQVRGVRRNRWTETRAEDLMVSGDALPSVRPETSLRAALDHLQRSGLDGLPVIEGGALTGVVTRRAVAEVVRDRLKARDATIPWLRP
jgi:Zn-dependent protease/predicted transcriptional regulator